MNFYSDENLGDETKGEQVSWTMKTVEAGSNRRLCFARCLTLLVDSFALSLAVKWENYHFYVKEKRLWTSFSISTVPRRFALRGLGHCLSCPVLWLGHKKSPIDKFRARQRSHKYSKIAFFHLNFVGDSIVKSATERKRPRPRWKIVGINNDAADWKDNATEHQRPSDIKTWFPNEDRAKKIYDALSHEAEPGEGFFGWQMLSLCLHRRKLFYWSRGGMDWELPLGFGMLAGAGMDGYL